MLRARFVGWLSLVLVGRSASALPGTPTPEPPGRWLVTGAIHDARVDHAAALLGDGRVLVCGGAAWMPGGTVTPLSTCELWSPVDESWTTAGALPEARTHVAAVPLGGDRIAFIGGWTASHTPTAAESEIDVWDAQRNEAAAVGKLPFPAERPHAVRLPDGQVFVIDDGPMFVVHDGAEPNTSRAAIWNPTTGRSKVDDAPSDSGPTAALLVDVRGTLTLVRTRATCREVAIWRRPVGQPWALAHVEPAPGCAVGAMAIDDGRIVYWFHQVAPAAFVWDPASGKSQLLEVPVPEHHQQLIPLGSGRWLAMGWGNAHFYDAGHGWVAINGVGGGDEASFTPLSDGRILMVGSSMTRVWTPSDYSPARPCANLTARLRSQSRDVPTRETVSPACLRAMATDPNLDASRALRELAERPAEMGVRLGIVAVCDLRPPWAVDLMVRGLEDKGSFGPAASCLTALGETDTPAARQAVDAAVQDVIRGDRQVSVLADAARSSEFVRARAADVLIASWTDRRSGFDQVREVVCRSPVPPTATEICRKSIPRQEHEWKEQPKRRHAWKMTAAATAIGAGLAVGGVVARNTDVGRVIAVAAGGLGAGALLFPSLAGSHPGPLGGVDEEAQGCLSVTLGVLGAVGAGLVTGSAGVSRAFVSITGGLLFTGLSLAAIWSF